MLKITYLEDGIYLEHLEESVEKWKADRMLVSLRAAVSIYVESSTASLILPANISCLRDLAELEAKKLIEITLCDEEYIEATLLGTWIASSPDSEEGIFVCDLNHSSEYFLYKLWQETQIASSVASE